MPRLVNDAGLPEPIYSAIKNRAYDKGEADFSVTELIAPAFQRALREKHTEEIVENASDMVFSLLGSSVHSILENAEIGNEDRYLREKRLFADVEGYRVSGGVDLIELATSTIHDFKVCSRWVGIFGVKDEWVQQLNIYRWLASKNSITIDNLKIHAIFRDWEKVKAVRGERDYPKKQVQTFDIKTWPLEAVEEFLSNRVHEHTQTRDRVNQSLSDDDLIRFVCSREERWEKPPAFAVMKRGRKSALRVLDNRVQADNYIIENGNNDSGMYIEERPGEAKRCGLYCDVKEFCPFGRNIKA